MARPRLAAIAIAFAVGVALADACGRLPGAMWMWGGAAALALVALRRWPALRLASVAVLAGATLGARETAERREAAAAVAPFVGDGREDVVVGVIEGAVERELGGVAFVLKVERVTGERGLEQATGDRRQATGDRRLAAPSRVLVTVAEGDELSPEMVGLLPGDRVEVRGMLRWPRGYRVPGAPEARRWADARGLVALIGTDPARVEELERGRGGWWRAAVVAQRHLADGVTREVGDRAGGGVLRALVTGDRGAMSEEDEARYRDTGASHVLAVSGLHLAALALLAFAVVRRAWAAVPALVLRVDATRAAAAIGAPLAVAYTFITGAPPSAVRALWVVLIMLLAAALDRRARLADALGAAALIMLAMRPASLWDASVQLSFAATAALGLAVMRPPRRRRLIARLAHRARQLVSLSLWTWAATAPIVAHHFGQVALAGPIANLFAVPAVEVFALPVGLAGALLADVAPDVGHALLAATAAVIARVGDGLGHLAAWIPPLPAPRPGWLGSTAWCAGLLAVAALARSPGAVARRRALVVLLAACAVLAGGWIWRGLVEPRQRDTLIATFLDVGQGDGAVVELPGGGVWLIDAGGLPFAPEAGGDLAAAHRLAESPGREAVARYLADRHIRRLDLVVLSHPHPDHYRGLCAVARAVDISEVWLARPADEEPLPDELVALLDELAARGARVRAPPAGTVLRQGGAALTVLAPEPLAGVAAADPARSINDNSLVLRLDVAGRRILFTGDLELEGEEDLLTRHGADVLAADVVKVPHHGSRTSSTARLVAATAPAIAVISCGVQNQFGFPDLDVVARWRDSGARVLRTDQVGAVTVTVGRDGRMAVATVDSPPEAE